MNIVFVKHYAGKPYAFYVPDELAPYVKKGRIVVVETIKGITTGLVDTDVISGPGALDVALKSGAYEPIKPVIGVDYEALKKVFYNNACNILGEHFEEKELPF